MLAVGHSSTEAATWPQSRKQRSFVIVGRRSTYFRRIDALVLERFVEKRVARSFVRYCRKRKIQSAAASDRVRIFDSSISEIPTFRDFLV